MKREKYHILKSTIFTSQKRRTLVYLCVFHVRESIIFRITDQKSVCQFVMHNVIAKAVWSQFLYQICSILNLKKISSRKMLSTLSKNMQIFVPNYSTKTQTLVGKLSFINFHFVGFKIRFVLIVYNKVITNWNQNFQWNIEKLFVYYTF